MHIAPESPLDEVLGARNSTVRPASPFVHTEGVTGSIPVTPTIQTIEMPKFMLFTRTRGEVLGRFGQTWGGLSA